MRRSNTFSFTITADCSTIQPDLYGGPSKVLLTQVRERERDREREEIFIVLTINNDNDYVM